MVMGVYAIIHRPTDTRYVGGSAQIEVRWRQHRRLLTRGEHPCIGLQASWMHDGAASFDWVILEVVTEPGLLKEREKAHRAATAVLFKGSSGAGYWMHPVAPLVERFWARVARTDDCWLWIGSRLKSGYGKIGIDGRQHYAHRVAYELLIGPIPDGLVIDHLCRVRACVNPAHLEAVTAKENMRRGREASLDLDKPRRPHCKYGHAYDAGNTRIRRDRGRDCRICHARRQRERQRKKREGPREPHV